MPLSHRWRQALTLLGIGTVLGFAVAGCVAERPSGAAVAMPVAGAASVSPPFGAPGQGQPADGRIEFGYASYYARSFAGRRTANGERYDPNLLTAAHRRLPMGTLVEVTRDDGRSVVVRVNDRGPYVGGRVIDLSRRAAEQLGMIREGTVRVRLRRL